MNVQRAFCFTDHWWGLFGMAITSLYISCISKCILSGFSAYAPSQPFHLLTLSTLTDLYDRV